MIEDVVLNVNDRSAILHLWAAWAEARSDRGDFWSSSSAAAERVRHVFDKALDVTGSVASVLVRQKKHCWLTGIALTRIVARHDDH